MAIVSKDTNGNWTLVPTNSFTVYTAKEHFLNSSARPFGSPSNVNICSPPTRCDLAILSKWQEDGHNDLESSLGVTVCGYATFVDSCLPPLRIRELPDVVSTKVWHGEWLLLDIVKRVSEDVGSFSAGSCDKVSILEIGAGCSLCGLLLAAKGMDVTVSDTRDGYEDAWKTWGNLVTMWK